MKIIVNELENKRNELARPCLKAKTKFQTLYLPFMLSLMDGQRVVDGNGRRANFSEGKESDIYFFYLLNVIF